MTESKRPTNSPMNCPACQRLKPGFIGAAGAGNSFSRFADIYICSDCGVGEAALGFFWRERCPADRIKPHHRSFIQKCDAALEEIEGYGMLEGYAAHAAAKVLVGNWRDAVRDGADPLKLMQDIDLAIVEMARFKNLICKV